VLVMQERRYIRKAIPVQAHQTRINQGAAYIFDVAIIPWEVAHLKRPGLPPKAPLFVSLTPQRDV